MTQDFLLGKAGLIQKENALAWPDSTIVQEKTGPLRSGLVVPGSRVSCETLIQDQPGLE